jgi:hypothetical protein
MNLNTLPRYNLRQLQLPTEYQLRLQQVKRRIALITGKVPSIETIIMCLVDEFINAHGVDVCDDDVSADPCTSGDPIDLRTVHSEGGRHD